MSDHLTSDDLMTADEVRKTLHIARSTLYTIPYFRARKVKVGVRAVRWRRQDVTMYIALNSGRAA